MTAALEAAFDAGITDQDVFFRMTPWQLGKHVARAVEGDTKQLRFGLSMAWHTAGFHRVKRMPDLRKIMEGLDPPEVKARRQKDVLMQAIGFAEARKAAGAEPPRKSRKPRKA